VNSTTIPSSSTLLTNTTGVTTFSAGTTGFTPSSATSGAVTLAGTLSTANGGTGSTPTSFGGIAYTTGTAFAYLNTQTVQPQFPSVYGNGIAPSTPVLATSIGSGSVVLSNSTIGSANSVLTSNGTTASFAAPVTSNYAQANLSGSLAITTTTANYTSVALTAGTWLVTACFANSCSTTGVLQVGIGPTSASLGSLYTGAYINQTSGLNYQNSVSRIIVLASSGTVYLNAGYYTSGAGSMTAAAGPGSIPNVTEIVAVRIA
jgi:hypothetical protein